MGQAFETALASANTRSTERQSLVDIKGFGKLPGFKEEAARFTEWLRKTTRFLIAAWGSANRPVIGRVEDRDNVITNDELEHQFRPLSDEPVGEILERCKHVHLAPSALTECESFDSVLGAAPSGLEALRRLVRRWVLSAEESAERSCDN